MALPLAPIALTALRIAPVAVVAWSAWRRIDVGRRDQRAEDALDELGEGLTRHGDVDGTRATGRIRRTVRLGSRGPGVEVDAAAIARFRIRRVRSK